MKKIFKNVNTVTITVTLEGKVFSYIGNNLLDSLSSRTRKEINSQMDNCKRETSCHLDSAFDIALDFEKMSQKYRI